MQPIVPSSTLNDTKDIDFLFGRYSISSEVVPYFQVSLPFKQTEEYLSLISDLPGAASMDWKITELFQRDIDWRRVNREIVKYLQDTSQPQFFNSITIALLPVKNGMISGFDEDGFTAPTSFEHADKVVESGGCIKEFGPLSCLYYRNWSTPEEAGASLGKLKWNRDEVKAVAIDGQHRLAALKESIRRGVLDSQKYKDTRIPVIFIVFDENLGYIGDHGREGYISVLRKLFIDLNKHAKSVSRARQILLDDRDPVAECVRALVGHRLTSGSSELDQDLPQIPLTLIDWHTEQAKFNKGPYLSTVLGIDWALGQLLAITPQRNLLDYDSAKKTIRRLQSKLNLNNKELQSALQRVEDCELNEKPFSFLQEDLDSVSTGFAAVYNNALCHLLTEIRPYKDLVTIRAKETLNPEFANWYSLKTQSANVDSYSPAHSQLEKYKQLIADSDDISIAGFEDNLKECETLKSKDEIAFSVVFQRALFWAYARIENKIDQLLPEEDIDSASAFDLDMTADDENDDHAVYDSKLEAARLLCNALNAISASVKDFYRLSCLFPSDSQEETDYFWIGSVSKIKETFDFSQVASRSTMWLILLIAYLYLIKTSYQVEEVDADSLFDSDIEVGNDELSKELSFCLKKLIDNGGPAQRLLAMRERDFEDKTLLEKEISTRAIWIWNKI